MAKTARKRGIRWCAPAAKLAFDSAERARSARDEQLDAREYEAVEEPDNGILQVYPCPHAPRDVKHWHIGGAINRQHRRPKPAKQVGGHPAVLLDALKKGIGL